MDQESKGKEIFRTLHLDRWVLPQGRELIETALDHAYILGTIDALKEAQEIVKSAPSPTVPS
jgi:hypothetical protein